jgi:hypothetical protein
MFARSLLTSRAPDQDMLLGWIQRPDNQALEKQTQLPFSWLVAAGKNPVGGWVGCFGSPVFHASLVAVGGWWFK